MARGTVTVVEGLIGAGKTTFAEELGAMLGGETLIFGEPDEKDEANPYLADYYKDPDRWAFTMQIHLLQARHKIHLDAQWYVLNRGGRRKGNAHAVIDRPFYGDTAFARLQLRRKHLQPREYETYRSLYHSMTANVLHPQFCIWLDTTPETSARRVTQRMEIQTGRKCEDTISLEYLAQLQQEIGHMISVLESSGVRIIKLNWNEDRNAEARRAEIARVAEVILTTEPPDLFLDLHRRTI